MRVVVPFAAGTPKTRLAGLLDKTERAAFARRMLEDVVAVLQDTAADIEVIATQSIGDIGVPVRVDDRPLTPAVNAVLDAEQPVAVVMADLALLTHSAIQEFLGTDGDVVIAPGRAGGTNALLVRVPEFRVDYHGTSFLDHLARAHGIGASVSVVDSYRLAIDIDEEADLVEVLLHGEGAAKRWLVEHGFQLSESEGRVGIERTTA